MTPKEYAEYQERVAYFFEVEGIDCLSIPPHNNEHEAIEPYISSWPCDVCGNHFQGNRYDMYGYNPKTKEVQGPYRVCEDCEYYIEYGQLDDMTMLEIDESEE